MHLRSLTLKGFKSFPNRTRLEFGPGIAVIIGPNGSGKSNITDAVLWALGEQSPLAIRGQTMQDVIFAGGHGVPSRNEAEVEVVIDNSEGALNSEFSEISILRYLNKDGESGYRLNGARCRLIDVVEVLSDTGLGKEMHSVVSQGRVEAIIHSKPRDRRLLIEEAAGLGKHRKRRRRAQLKLERTEENLSRALDVEREARSRLKPLKRQAEAAELHERLERQSLEARMELAAEGERAIRLELGEAESRAAAAKAERDRVEELLTAVARRREAAEESFAAHTKGRERLQARLYAARSAAERIGMRLERARDASGAAAERAGRRRHQLDLLEAEAGAPAPEGGRHAELERELAALDEGREERLAAELSGLEDELGHVRERHEELCRVAAAHRQRLEEAERAADDARAARAHAEREAESARAEAASAGAELAAVNQFVRGAGAAERGARPLAQGLGAERGYELALAAVLGPRLTAGVVDDLRSGQELLDAAGERGGSALVAGAGGHSGAGSSSPVAGAERLLDHVRPEHGFIELAARLLADAWVVNSLDSLPEHFHGVAVTRAGRLFDSRSGEVVQAPAGGAERLLEELNRRGGLVAASEQAVAREAGAREALGAAARAVAVADTEREETDTALR